MNDKKVIAIYLLQKHAAEQNRFKEALKAIVAWLKRTGGNIKEWFSNFFSKRKAAQPVATTPAVTPKKPSLDIPVTYPGTAAAKPAAKFTPLTKADMQKTLMDIDKARLSNADSTLENMRQAERVPTKPATPAPVISTDDSTDTLSQLAAKPTMTGKQKLNLAKDVINEKSIQDLMANAGDLAIPASPSAKPKSKLDKAKEALAPKPVATTKPSITEATDMDKIREQAVARLSEILGIRG